MNQFFYTIITLCLIVCGLQAKRTHSYRMEIWTPEEELAGFELPDGFVIELVASEKDGIVNPIDLAFDDAGRLWTQTAEMYPLDPFGDVNFSQIRELMEDPELMQKNPEFQRILALYEGRTRGTDRILVIDNPTSKIPSRPRVWAEGLAIPQSILPYKNGAFVAQGSELFFLDDTDGDGTSDTKRRLLTGFGITDTHTMAHLLIRAPGGWVHFAHGALNKGEVKSLVSGATTSVNYNKTFRMSLDGARLEVVSSGLNNTWGYQLRANGQWYGTEANDLTWSVVPMEPGTGFKGIGDDRIRPYQPWIPELHDFRVGGTGISGLEFSEDGEAGFPPEFKNVAILANPITSTLNCVRIVRNPDGSIDAELLPDLLKSRDDWFRPVNVEFGPDGCLYIADWYNKIISHNELPRTHPERDKSHGRIWRIRHVSQKPRDIPNLYTVSNEDLVGHLKSPILWEKRAAWHQIADRKATELAPDLVRLARDEDAGTTTRIHALWSLESISHLDTRLMDQLLKSPDDELRREAIRSLAGFEMSPKRMANFLNGFLDDPNVMVRSQVLRTLADYGQANREIINTLVSYCRPDIPGLSLGGPYERTFERYLARMALEQYPEALLDYLDGRASRQQSPNNLFWAIQALPLKDREPYFLDLWDAVGSYPWDAATFIEIINSLENKAIRKAVEPTFKDLWKARRLAELAVENLDRIPLQDLRPLLEAPAAFLLGSPDQFDQAVALETVQAYKIRGQEDAVIRLLESSSSNSVVLSAAIAALEWQPSKKVRTALERVFENGAQGFKVRLATLKALIRAKGKPNETTLRSFVATQDDSQTDDFLRTLSGSKSGSQILWDTLEAGYLEEEVFSNSTLERMVDAGVEAPDLEALYERRIEEKKAAYQATFETFMEIAETGGGDPGAGQPLFNSICLSCHSVGSTGAGWAPALDGSGYRDHEALLTAILDPGAAIEGAYRLRRVRKTDGGAVEGYLEKQDDRGVTMRFMGGGSLFIPKTEVNEVQTVPGRSVMPEGLIDTLPHEQVANLLAYIRTLK